jgi:hypothetical protein
LGTAATRTDRKLTEFLGLVKRSEEAIDHPEWTETIEPQVLIIEGLIAFKNVIPADDFSRGMEKMRMLLGIEPERWADLIELTDRMEIRRALRFNPMVKGGRTSKAESVYPFDDGTWLGTYTKYTDLTECPRAWHFWCGCAAIGASCRRNLYIDVGQFVVWPNHYLLLIGPTGEGKGIAIRALRDVLSRLNRYLEEEQVPPWMHIKLMPEKCTPERLINLLKCEEEVFTKYVEKKGTQLKRILHGQTEAVGVLAAEELITLLGRQAYHSNMMIGLLTTLWDCPREWSDSTLIRGDTKLHNTALTLIGGTTLEWVRTSMAEDIFQGGFMGRCMVSTRTGTLREYDRPPPMDPITANHLAKGLVRWNMLSDAEFVGSDAWWRYHKEWYHGHKSVGNTDPRMQGYYQRKRGHMLRLGAMLALSNERTTGELKDIELAHQIINAEEKHMPGYFREVDAHPDSLMTDRVLAVLRGERRITRSQLNRLTRHICGNRYNLDRCIKTLLEQGRIRECLEKRGSSIRTTTRYDVTADDGD